jgi:poly(beta-D-mannuronate) lyase
MCIRFLCTKFNAPIWICFFWIGTVAGAEFLVKDSDEFHRQMKVIEPGDVLLLADGQWTDVELLATGEGTLESPITIRAQHPGKVILDGNSRVRISGEHIVVDGLRFIGAWHETALLEFREDSKRLSSSCRLTNCEFVDCHNPPGKSHEFKYLSVYGRANTVDHCRFSGKTNRGTTLVVWLDQNGGGHSIRQNHFGLRPPLGMNGGETIRIGDSESSHLSAHCIIEGNLFEQCDGEAEIISNKSCDNVYRKNVFLRCAGALTLRHGHRCRVEKNMFLGEKARGTGGVRIVGSDHVVINNYFERLEGSEHRSALVLMNGIENSPANGYQAVQRAQIIHNTFADCKRTILVGADNDEDDPIAPRDCRFRGNAIFSRRGPMIDVREKVEGFLWESNLYFGDGELGVEKSKGIRLAKQPLMEREGKGWVMFADSALINQGSSKDPTPRTDILGAKRDESSDIGCMEWPLSDSRNWLNGSVGPDWAPVPLGRKNE